MNKSDKTKFFYGADPEGNWLARRLGRNLNASEAIYPRMKKQDDQGRPIRWPSKEEVKKQMSQVPQAPQKASASPNKAVSTNKTALANKPAPRAGGTTLSNAQQHFANKHYSVECELNPEARLKAKIEKTRFFTDHYQYTYDAKHHLTQVYFNGKLTEAYEYNAEGQRIRQFSAHNSQNLRLKYNSQGQLVRMGDTIFSYDEYGALARKIYSPEHNPKHEETRFFYNGGTRLDRVMLPSGDEISYEYGRGEQLQAQNPLRKFKNGKLVMEYEWQDPFRLARCFDLEREVEFHFRYGGRLCPEAVRITAHRPKPKLEHADFLCGCDQVGTLKYISASPTAALAHIQYDSFGNIIKNTKPSLPIPIGFAGGLVDHDTGLVRFGYRDYDPACGRFTCPDPLGDTGGDHDLYDYCVDDPVNCADPEGLFGFLLPFLAVKAAGLATGALGILGTSAIFDKINGTDSANDVIKVLPKAGTASYLSALPTTIRNNPARWLATQAVFNSSMGGRQGESNEPNKQK